MTKSEDEYGNEQPLDVEGIVQLSSSQGEGFWLREICIQLAALREELMNIRDKI